MKRRFQFGLRTLVGMVGLAAAVLGMLVSFPATHRVSQLSAWSAVFAELALIAVALSILHTVGNRTRYDFAVGFASFATPHWLFLQPMGPGKRHVLWHDDVLFYWFQEAFSRGFFDIEWLGIQLNFQYDDVDLFLYSAETLVIGIAGGIYARYIGRQRAASVAHHNEQRA